MPATMPPIDSEQSNAIEWPTMLVMLLTYACWLSLTWWHATFPVAILVVALGILIALHSSLQHEVIHGHPTRWQPFNTVMAFPALGLAVPYQRYEILHLQHHRNWLLTDPYDDSESYFLANAQWCRCNKIIQALLNVNNTLLGRLTVGPIIMLVRMCITELSESKYSADVKIAWAWHAAGMTLVFTWLWLVQFPVVVYLCAAYFGISLLMLRSYGEHLPEHNTDHRSAIIKSNAFMRLLYLNNNFHRVHHDHPEVAWYKLPSMYHAHYKQHTVHVYRGYFSLFKCFALKPRYPVEHPFLGKD